MTGLALLAVVGVVLAAAGVAVAVAVARNRDRRNQVVAGVPTTAPASWAGAHTPEARLHRRLRDAARSAATAARRPGAPLWGGRQAVEEAALAVDERLVRISAVPERQRGPLLAEVTAQVAAVERAAAGLVAPRADGAVLDEVGAALERVRVLAEAREEVERTATPWALPELQDDATPAPEAGTADEGGRADGAPGGASASG